MRPFTWLGVAVAVASSVGSFGWVTQQSTQAVELNGQTYFDRPPLLANASTTRNTTMVWEPTYYFTLQVPEDAGEPLGRVLIAQQDGNTAAREIRFEPDETIAFTGTPRNRDESLDIADAVYDSDAQSMTVTFNQPVPPGTTVTIGLQPERNPRLGGVYLFGVTVYPEGEPAYGQFIGYGRLHFYDRDNPFWF
ncbi:MAG: DUF2808 domain-containing protein [Elainellaceae cyanobacterium]